MEIEENFNKLINYKMTLTIFVYIFTFTILHGMYFLYQH